MFVYTNTPRSKRPVTTEAKIGKVFSTNPKKKFDTASLAGEYVVENAYSGGGGTGHGDHDVYPDGWNVTARKLKNGKHDPTGPVVSFYQSGSFTAMNTDVPVVRRMEVSFRFQIRKLGGTTRAQAQAPVRFF
jgi:hypothetical protein